MWFFNWKMTAVPAWNCLLCLLVVCSRAAVRASQRFLLSLSHHCCPIAVTGVRGQSWCSSSDRIHKSTSVLAFFKLFSVLLHNFSMNYTNKWVFFFMFSEMIFFNTWIWNLIQHLFHPVLPDFRLSPCPSMLCLMMHYIFKTAWLCQSFSEGDMKWPFKCSHVHSFRQSWRAIMWHRIQVS